MEVFLYQKDCQPQGPSVPLITLRNELGRSGPFQSRCYLWFVGVCVHTPKDIPGQQSVSHQSFSPFPYEKLVVGLLFITGVQPLLGYNTTALNYFRISIQIF